MHSERRSCDDGQGGSVSAVVAHPDKETGRPGVVLAHGAGSNMDTPLLVFLQQELAAGGYLTVRFNFPYTEQRRKIPDRAPVLERCFRSVLTAMRTELDVRRLVIGGKSMGGRMATHLAAAGEVLDGLVLLGYPLHPAGQPDKRRTSHLPRIVAPMLFFAGTRDPLCTLSLLREALAPLRASTTLHVIEDGDHSFAVRRSSGRAQADVYRDIAATTLAWLGRLGE